MPVTGTRVVTMPRSATADLVFLPVAGHFCATIWIEILARTTSAAIC